MVAALIDQAEREASRLVGNTVSVAVKGKTLRKFGRVASVETSLTTLAEFPTGVLNETYATGNTIDSIVSTSTADVGQVVHVEGHTLDSEGFHFVTQTVTLSGRTPVPLPVSLARSTSAWNLSATEVAGNVSIYDSAAAGGVTLGTPNTGTSVHLMIMGTRGTIGQRSRKLSTTISYRDFWFVEQCWARALRASGLVIGVDAEIEYRTWSEGAFGGWIPTGVDLTMRTTDYPRDSQDLAPFLIIPPNSDVRMVASASAASSEVLGTISGLLAIIV